MASPVFWGLQAQEGHGRSRGCVRTAFISIKKGGIPRSALIRVKSRRITIGIIFTTIPTVIIVGGAALSFPPSISPAKATVR